MRLEQLRYFVETAEQKSISKAADTLYVSQPNLSRAVKALENELNVELLVRNNHGVSLTELGENFYHYAKSIVKQLDAIETYKYILAEERISRLSVSVASLFLEDTMMLEYYQSIQEKSTDISILETTLKPLIEQVANLVSEIGVATLNTAQFGMFKKMADLKGLKVEELDRQKVYVHFRQDHPLSKKKILKSKDLISYPHVHLPHDELSYINNSFDLGEISMLDIKQTVIMNNYHAIMRMISHTDGWLMGNAWQVKELTHSRIESRQLADSELESILVFVYREKEMLSEEAVKFLDMIRGRYLK